MQTAVIAERQFSRAFHSELDRQALIDVTAKNIEAAIYADILTNERNCFDVADDIPGNLDTEAVKLLVRAALRGGRETVLQIVLDEIDAAVKRVAEYRAIAEVEAMTPEAFLPA